MLCAPGIRRFAAALAALGLTVALGACAREAPLEERVRQRLEAKDFDGALAVLDQRLAREPTDEGARVLRVRVVLAAGRLDEALRDYAALPEALIEKNPRLARHVALTLVWDALRRDDKYFQAGAAIALSALGDAEALPLFREALGHESPAVRAPVLRGLSRLKSDEAVALAEAALKDADDGVRAVAAEALGAMGAERARGALGAAFAKDPVPVVRLRAAVALALLGDEEAKSVLRRTVLARDEAEPAPPGGAGGGRGAPAWTLFVNANRPAEREYVHVVAAEALARAGDPEGRAALVQRLDPALKFNALFAAEALSNLGDPAPRKFLTEALGDPAFRENRMYAAWTLARLGDGAGVLAVVALAADGDEKVRRQAVWTLGQMGRLAPVGVLRKALADQDLLVRYQAAWALGEVLMAAAPPPAPAPLPLTPAGRG